MTPKINPLSTALKILSKALCLYKHTDPLWESTFYQNDNGCEMRAICRRCQRVIQKQVISDAFLLGKESILVWNEGIIRQLKVKKETKP